MSLTVSTYHTPVRVASVTQAPTVAAVLNFAEKMATSIPPNRRIERPVFWIQTGFERLMRIVCRVAIWVFNHGAMQRAKEEMQTATPERICDLAKPFAPFFPEFALLAFIYGDKNDAKIKELEALWLPYGYLLTSDLSSSLVQKEAEKRNLLNPFADLITFEVANSSFSEEAKVEKALDLLQVASSSLRKDNLDFIAHVISETFIALFPEGIPDHKTDLWDQLEDLISDAETIGGQKRAEYLKDHLLIFVKTFLKGSEDVLMRLIRAHIRQANQPNSAKLLNHLSQDRWAKFIKDDELRIIQKCLHDDVENDPSILLGTLFNKFEEAEMNLQDMAECYLFPSPYHERSSAKLIKYYFDDGYPTGTDGLYTAIFSIEDKQIHYVSHLLRESGQVTLIPGFTSPKDHDARTYYLLEEDLNHLEKKNFDGVSQMLERQSFDLIQAGFKDWKFSIENLRKLAKLYQDKLDTVKLSFVSVGRKERLAGDEVEATRLELVKRMEEAWRTKFPEDKKFSLAEFREIELMDELNELIKILEEP